MDEIEEISISQDAQKFVKTLADLPQEKYHKVGNLLDKLSHQQEIEAHLEDRRGWRYMWQRTPKPYLLMLGYLVFLAPVGSVAYYAIQNISEEMRVLYLVILLLILILPLGVVFYLSYNYVKHKIKEEISIKKE